MNKIAKVLEQVETERLSYTVKEAAKVLGISETSLYAMVYMNSIPFKRVQSRGKGKYGRILFSRAALEKWLEGEGALAEG